MRRLEGLVTMVLFALLVPAPTAEAETYWVPRGGPCGRGRWGGLEVGRQRLDRILPLPAVGAAGRIQFADGTEVALAPDRSGNLLVASLPAAARPPLDVVLFVRLVPGFPEFRFDFNFPFIDPCPAP